ncbi:MAG: helix-turn-helix domain-containing protein [bacterium]
MKYDEFKKDKIDLRAPLLIDMHRAADMLGICYRSIQNLIYKRQIGFVKIGKNYKFRPEDLNNFIEKNYIKPIK